MMLILCATDTVTFADQAYDVDRELRAAPVCNTLSYVYIVGIEGVGHHGVSPAIATIAKSCNKHVIYEPQQLRVFQRKKLSKVFKSHIEKIGTTSYQSNDVVIIEDASFPSGRNFREAEESGSGQYDLEWTQRELHTHVPGIRVRYLHLTRDFYRTVASHPEFDGGFQKHARVLHSFVLRINSEYNKITHKYPDIWRQISYEWFTNLDVYNCTTIVSAVIDFMQWDHCDVGAACQKISTVIRRETKKEINLVDFAHAKAYDVTTPIPVLDISPNRTYSFTTTTRASQTHKPQQLTPLNLQGDTQRRASAAKISATAASVGMQYMRGSHQLNRDKTAKAPVRCNHAGGNA